MALSIKTAEADRLARELAKLTGETMTEAVTRSLEERLGRIRREQVSDRPARVRAFLDRVRPRLDTRPVTREEWDAACDDPLLTGREE